MTVALTKIEADVLGRSIGYKNNRVLSLISASEYSLADIFKNVNPLDKHFLNSIPNGFLNEVQMKAKQDVIKEDSESNKLFQMRNTRRQEQKDKVNKVLEAENAQLRKVDIKIKASPSLGSLLRSSNRMLNASINNSISQNYDSVNQNT